MPIYCVQTDQKKIALTFDAAWGNEDTADLLSILARNQIHATFFLTGSWVDAYPDDLKAIAAAGHDIGNHSQTHPEMSTLSKEQIRDELMPVSYTHLILYIVCQQQSKSVFLSYKFE